MKNINQNNKMQATISWRIFQIAFFAIIGLVFYSIVTFNIPLFLFFLFATLVGFLFNRKSRTLISFFKKIKANKFFDIKRIYDEEVPKQETTLFAFHPHSVWSYGLLMNLNYTDDPEDKISNMVGLGSRFILNLPIFGACFKMWGVQAINPDNLKRLMKKKQTIGMVPGGYEEATITTPKEVRVFIQNRKGFIKYALKYGYTIRPSVLLKEHQLYNTFDYFTKFRLFMNKFKMPAVIFWSRFGPLLPSSSEIITVVGKGIRSQKEWEEGYEPSREEIDEVHKQYKEEIERLYEKYKQLNGNVGLKFY